MAGQIRDRAVLVTGGARGIGLAIATRLSQEGARVAIADLDEDEARRRAAALPRAGLGVHLDVSDSESFAAAVTAAEATYGPLDVLVNNAGVMWVGGFASEPNGATRRMLDVNVVGVVNGFRTVAAGMRGRGSGHIVTVASAASKLAPPGEATYAATKHAVHGYCSAVRAELRGTGVRVSVIMPGVVDTELAAGTVTGAVRRLQPPEVAAAVVRVLRRPRFEVYVPRQIGGFVRATALLPQPLRDLVLARAVPDQVRGTDRGARSGYESRAVTPEDPPPGTPD